MKFIIKVVVVVVFVVLVAVVEEVFEMNFYFASFYFVFVISKTVEIIPQRLQCFNYTKPADLPGTQRSRWLLRLEFHQSLSWLAIFSNSALRAQVGHSINDYL